MKRFTVLGLVMSCLLGIACTGEKIELDQGLILATIRPYDLIASELVDESYRVETLLPPTASPHTWSPRPSDLKRIKQAGLIIANGLGLEEKLGGIFKETAPNNLIAASALKITATNHAQPEFETDPHLWTDPWLMLEFAKSLVGHLERRDPAGKDFFMLKLTSFSNRIFSLDARIREDLASLSGRAVVTFHDAFPRFFARYGIERVASFMPTPGREPGPADLVSLGEKIKANRVRALYGEVQLDSKSVEILSREYSLPVYTLDPIGSSPEITNYSSLIEYNWNLLKKGLGGD